MFLWIVKHHSFTITIAPVGSTMLVVMHTSSRLDRKVLWFEEISAHEFDCIDFFPAFSLPRWLFSGLICYLLQMTCSFVSSESHSSFQIAMIFLLDTILNSKTVLVVNIAPEYSPCDTFQAFSYCDLWVKLRWEVC